MNLDENYDFSVDKYCELADDDNCKLVILCNPNNPTGNLLDDEKVIEVIKQNSQRIVMIDETYFEFSGKTFKDRIDEFPNLVIVRSFSKAFSAAGLRFGYIISRKENINEFKKIMTIFHSSMMIQATVLTMLENKEIFLEQVAETNRQKKIVFEELSNLHAVTVKKSATNFLAFTIGENTIDLFNFLSDNDIALRNIGAHPLLKNYIRVTICNEEENKLFVEKVREYFILTQRDSNTEKI
jgi:histidinol-phosphate aminotransferase